MTTTTTTTTTTIERSLPSRNGGDRPRNPDTSVHERHCSEEKLQLGRVRESIEGHSASIEAHHTLTETKLRYRIESRVYPVYVANVELIVLARSRI